MDQYKIVLLGKIIPVIITTRAWRTELSRKLAEYTSSRYQCLTPAMIFVQRERFFFSLARALSPMLLVNNVNKWLGDSLGLLSDVHDDKPQSLHTLPVSKRRVFTLHSNFWGTSPSVYNIHLYYTTMQQIKILHNYFIKIKSTAWSHKPSSLQQFTIINIRD